MTMGSASDKLDAFGVEAVCEALAAGTSQTELERELGISHWPFVCWSRADPARAEQIRSARAEGAARWDERAERVLLDISAQIEEGIDSKIVLGRARELAQHYRWRASKTNPVQYGDNMRVTEESKTEITHRFVLLGESEAKTALDWEKSAKLLTAPTAPPADA